MSNLVASLAHGLVLSLGLHSKDGNVRHRMVQVLISKKLLKMSAIKPRDQTPISESSLCGASKLLDRHALSVVFLIAFSLRVTFVLLYGPSSPPVQWGDDAKYDVIAYKLVSQHEYTTTWYPPGYPLFVAVVYSLFGRSWLVLRILQAAFGAATCVLTCKLGTRLLTRRSGILAGLILAVYPGHIFWSWRVMGEALYMMLLVLGVLLAIDLSQRPQIARAMIVGLVVGYAQLVKSNLFLFPPFLLVWFLITARAGIPQRIRCVAALVLGLALMSAITPLANLISPMRQAVLLPGNAGYSLWAGNNPLVDGCYISAEYTPEGKAYIESHGLTEQLERADPAERDRIFRTLALTWMRENPGKFLLLCLKKLNNSFGLFPRAAIFERDPRAAVVHLLTYGPVAAFALAGIIATRRRWRDFSLLYLAILSYVVSVVLFFGTPRYTILIIPFLVVFASYPMALCFDRLTRRPREQSAAS
jgi:4-amino-4-deoxy-L-arabinose transferase-like glycosyltransferase